MGAGLLAGCGADAPAIGSRGQAISPGKTDDPLNPAYPSVVVFERNNQRLCSGVFITPHLIVTAAHCFRGDRDSAPGEGFWCSVDVPCSGGVRITAGQCAPFMQTGLPPAPRGFARDGWLAGHVTPGSYVAWDGVEPGRGHRYEVDYVWFARPRPEYPDVAIVHSKDAFYDESLIVSLIDEATFNATLLDAPESPLRRREAIVVGYSSEHYEKSARRYANVQLTGQGSEYCYTFGPSLADPGDSGGGLFVTVEHNGQPVKRLAGWTCYG